MTDNIRKELDLAMLVASQRPDALTASQIMVDLIKIYPFVDFCDFENSLRRINSPMFLVAIPARFAPQGLYVAFPSQDGKVEPKGHYVWVGVHGPEEARQTMAIHGINSETENLKLLKEDTGVLMRRSQ
ncbi:MAG: hypothetical protein ACXVA9_08520 [Bdellovibrionales bacterium]